MIPKSNCIVQLVGNKSRVINGELWSPLEVNEGTESSQRSGQCSSGSVFLPFFYDSFNKEKEK